MAGRKHRKHKQVGTRAEFVRRQVQTRKFLRAYRRLGVVGPSLREAGVGRETFERWLTSDPSFTKAFEHARLDVSDVWVRHLMNKAETGDSSTLRFLVRGLLPAQFGSAAERVQEQKRIAAERELSVSDRWALAEQEPFDAK